MILMLAKRMRHVAIVLVILASTVVPSLAQQGRSPAQSTPEATAVTQTASEPVEWRVENVTPVEIDGIPVTMSPDGAWIAGVNLDRQVCVWDVATMEPTCDQADRIPVTTDSLVWSPDSTAVAFTEDAFLSAYDSDIYVFELGASTSVNLTDDAFKGGMLEAMDNGSALVDTTPVWDLDSQSIYFMRTDAGAETQTSDLMRISRTGGEPELLDTVADTPFAVYNPMRVLSDGTLLYLVTSLAPDAPGDGFWLRAPDGESRQVLSVASIPEYPHPVMSDVHEGNGTVRIAGYSASNLARLDPDAPIAFVFDLESGEVTPVETDDPDLITWAITFSPDGETTWSGVFGATVPALLREFNGEQRVIELGNGEATSPSGASRFASIEWRGENTLFVPSGITRGSFIVTMTSDTGDTTATPCGCVPPEDPGT